MKKRYQNYDDFVREHTLEDKNDNYPITYSLIIILFLIYLFEVFYLSKHQVLFDLLVTSPLHLLNGNFYSVLTSVFLHADIVHLLSNCLALFIFGTVVEKHLKFKMLFVFIGSGVIANLVSHGISFLTGDIFSSLGASGGIAGLIIFAILFDPISFTKIFILPIPIFILGWLLILSDIIGLSNPSQVNHFAHLGGYLALLVLFFFLEFRHRKKIMLGFVINLFLLVLTYSLVSFTDVEKIRLFIGF